MKESLVDAISGCCAGVVGTVLGYPLDVIKTNMQYHSNSNVTIRSIIHKIYSENGIMGFYRGIASPLTALTILNTVNFSSYQYFRRLFHRDNPPKYYDYSISLSAICVGPIASSISTPFEYIKTQMQLDMKSSSRKYYSSLHALRTISTNYGFKTIYSGHVVNTSREMLFLGVYFTTYENCKIIFREYLPTHLSVLAAGGISGAMGWIISYPLDCIKAHIQGRSVELYSHPKDSAFHVFKNLVSYKGILGLYSGIVPSVTRAFLVSSSRFAVYESVHYILR